MHERLSASTLSLALAALVSGALGAPFAAIAAAPASPASRPPNVILIVADDLGYGELTLQGHAKDIPTPNIDGIARNGVRFSDGYVSAPLCGPTRAGLLTGRYQQRFGQEFNAPTNANADSDVGLPRGETTLAERLAPLGYATGMVGKWHLGLAPEQTPLRRGFGFFFGFLGGEHPYLPGAKSAQLFRGADATLETEYLTDAFAREAVAFIDQHASQPFFLYLAFNAVHPPLQAPEKYLSRFPGIADPKRRTYAAVTAAMDDAVGRVLGRLEALHLTQHTLVFFLSDNGGRTAVTTSSNAPLRGSKGQMWEGGIRIPFLVQWPGRLPAGRTYPLPVSSLDVHPTAMAASGAAISPAWKLDGVNLLPFLSGDGGARPHETLYWRMGDKHAIRDGDWKLTVESGKAPALFDLASDLGEQRDLAVAQPAKLKALAARYQAWSSEVGSPEAGASSGAPGAAASNFDRRFHQLDANGDGKLTPAELPRPPVFVQMDVDGDGVISLDEAKAFWSARK